MPEDGGALMYGTGSRVWEGLGNLNTYNFSKMAGNLALRESAYAGHPLTRAQPTMYVLDLEHSCNARSNLSSFCTLSKAVVGGGK